MNIKILFFATYRDLTGQSQVKIEMPGIPTIQEVKDHLETAFPRLKGHLKNAVASINMDFAMDEDLVPEQAEVAFFPPVSGGSQKYTLVKVTHDPISVDQTTTLVTFPTTGAVCSFTGVVRGETVGGIFPQTSRLEYEAYIPMAEAKMNQIADEIRERWADIEGIALIQRIGSIEPGTASVVIACSAAHRNTGVFEAAHYGIDRLKEIVPVWKKEINSQGTVWVEGEYHPGKGE